MKSLITNKIIQKYVLIWIVYWLIVVGLTVVYFKPAGYTFLHNNHVIISYFIFVTIIGHLIFRRIGEQAKLKSPKLQLPLIVLSGVIFVTLSVGMKQFFPLTVEGSKLIEGMGFFYPLLTWGTALGKLADIIFQQTLIVALVLFLKKHCQRPREVVEIFTLVFFVLHVPLLINFGIMGLIFIIPSLFAGAIFSYLITFYSWGVLGSMLVHQYYYISMAIILRLLYNH